MIDLKFSKLESSSKFASGSMKDLNSVERMAFEQIILGMAASSLRFIAFAHKQILEEEHEIGEGRKKIEKDRLTLIGLMGDKGPDPCRQGVRKAVDGYNTLLVKDSETKRISSQLDHCRIPTLLSSAKQVVEMNRQYHPIGEPIVKSGAVLQASGLLYVLDFLL